MVNIFSIYPVVSCSFGAALMLIIAFAFSLERKAISFIQIAKMLAIYLMVAVTILKTTVGDSLLNALIRMAYGMQEATQAGSLFVLGTLSENIQPWGFIFAFQVLPITIFFSAFVALLSYYGIIQALIKSLAYVIRPILGTTSSETACALGKSVLGATEAPLLVYNFLFSMSTSEIFSVMVSCMSMIAASLFAAYMQLGVSGSHLIAANIMGVFGALMFSKIIYPSKAHTKKTAGNDILPEAKRSTNVVEAVIKGTMDGLNITLAIAAMLISFLALIASFNFIFGFILSLVGLPIITIQQVGGYLLSPIGILFGLEYSEALKVSELIATKIVTNEMIAYVDMVKSGLSDRGLLVATYAICGFANISIVGIVVGALGSLMPARLKEMSSIAWHALLAATLSNLFSAYIVGIIL